MPSCYKIALSTLPTPPLAPCRACRGTRFWRSVHDIVVCGDCHPPPSPALVAAWLDTGFERTAEEHR